jgi:hypothetical protein
MAGTTDNDDNSPLDVDDELFADSRATATTTIKVPEEGFPDGVNRDVKVEDRDGLAVFEGDIVLGNLDAAVPKGLGIVGENFRWPDGVVPYEADPEVTALAQAAARHWEERTNGRIQFLPRTEENADWIHVKRLSGSWSYVGRQGGKQELSLGASATVGTAVHEFGHALGLWHEQSRGDRDRHVTVNLDKVHPDNRHNFDKHIADGFDIGTYDFGSIMHYSRTAFSTDGSDTIVTRNGEPIGQRNGVSAGDLAAIARLYP